jgi:hypothetical protein
LSHTQVQWGRGTTGQVAAYTGPTGELILNTDDWSLQAQDGITAGGCLVRPRLNVRAVTATGSQTVAPTDDLIAWAPTTPAATTFTLPSSPRIGEQHVFKYLAASGGFVMSVAAPAGQTIDGQASVAIAALYGELRVLFIGGSAWIVLSETSVPGAYTPTDQSGAGLSFTGISVQYSLGGNLVRLYGTLSYPATANGADAAISLPVAVPNQNYAQAPGAVMTTAGGVALVLVPVKNTATAAMRNAGNGNAVANASLSGAAISFSLAYPAS